MTTERVIDDLIHRNIDLDSNFERRIVEMIFAEKRIPLRRHVRTHVCDEFGEVDILAQFMFEDGLYIAHIENKIAAVEQPGQFKRYQQRKQDAERNGNFRRVRTAILAPAKYLNATDVALFDVVVKYEDVAPMLGNPADQDLINRAIEYGHAAIPPDIQRTHFKSQYFVFASEAWSGARKNTDTLQPKGNKVSYFLGLKEFSDSVKLSCIEHVVFDDNPNSAIKGDQGRLRAMIQMGGPAECQQWRERFARAAPNHFKVDQARDGKLRFYVNVCPDPPPVHIAKRLPGSTEVIIADAEEQAEAIRECSRQAKELHDWVRTQARRL